jgi:hypothetical protein
MHWMPLDEEHSQLLFCELLFRGKCCIGKQLAGSILCWLLIASILAFRLSACTGRCLAEIFLCCSFCRSWLRNVECTGRDPANSHFGFLFPSPSSCWINDCTCRHSVMSRSDQRLLDFEPRRSRLHWRVFRENGSNDISEGRIFVESTALATSGDGLSQLFGLEIFMSATPNSNSRQSVKSPPG